MKSGILLFALLILGTFVIPYNIQNSYGDRNLLYTIHRTAGSGDVNTENLRKERCFVHVTIGVYSAHHNNLHRNNPDKTFYPGDAFDYQTTTWKSGCGEFFQPCPIQSTPNNSIPNGPNCIKNKTYGARSDSGTGVISPNYEAGTVSLSKKAMAEQYVCRKGNNGWSCGWQTVTSSATQAIPMRLPNLTVDMWTVGEEFTEDVGYMSRNLDESYYVWDAINVVHNLIYLFKNDRVGTIFVEYEKIHDPLALEDEFFCDVAFCINTMEIPGFLPWTGEFDYGGGNTVFNATSLDDIGEHEIKYIARLYNITPQIDEFTQTIDELIVEYEPVYDSYVYPVLSDDERLAIHDRMEYELLDGTVSETDYSDSIDLIWGEAHNVGIITNELPVKKSEEISDQLIPTEFPNVVPFEVEQHETANFVKAGYGKIKFDYPGLYDVLVDPVLNIPRFENATVFDTLQSSYFAGHQVTHLTNTEYMYPESFFHNTLSVKAVDSEGNQDNTIEITLKIMPRLDIPGTQYIDGYMHDKILFDTQDDGFSQIITGLDVDKNPIVVVNGHDIYTLDEIEGSGFGSVSIDKTRRVLSSFTQYDTIEEQTFSNDDVTDISDKYLLDTEDAILPIPLTTGLDALSPFTISITASDGINEITNTFDQTWYDFSIDYSYEINMDDDNVLNIERDPGNMRVLKYFYDENFGELESLEINNVIFEDDNLPECFRIKSTGACYLPVPEYYQLDKLYIIGTNIWDGTSVETLSEITPEMLNPVVSDPIDSILNLTMFDFVLILLVLMLVAYISYKIIHHISAKTNQTNHNVI